jgi:single-stranded-DNA-specific exonuclease
MRTVILTHGDCDGVCSGALALAANPGAKVFFTNPVSILSDIAEAKGCERLVACDLAINISTVDRFISLMEEQSRGSEIIYIDHHPLPPGFQAPWLFHDIDSSGSLLTYKYFREALDRDMSRVAMYGAIGDYRDNDPLAVEMTLQWDKRSLYYEGGIVSQGVERERWDYDFKRAMVDALSRNMLPSGIKELALRAAESSKEENEMRKRVEKSVVPMKKLAYVIEPHGSLSKAAIYARAYGTTPVGVSAELRPEKGRYEISVRAVRGFDLNIVLDRVATKYGGTGGGHSMAGGARVPEKYLLPFLQELDASLAG